MGRIGIGIGGPGSIGANPAVYSASAPEDVDLVISANDDLRAGRLNSDGNYYNITFPDDYLGGADLFASARSGAGAKIGSGVDASANLNIILNIPDGMDIGANTSGNFGSKTLGGAGAFAGAKYEIRGVWDPAYSANPNFGGYLSDPSLVINLDTNHWDSSIYSRLNLTVNNHGNTIGAGGSGGYDGARSSDPLKWVGGGGGGGGMGLHPDPWPAGTRFESSDNFSSGAWIAGQGGGGWRTGTASGWGSDGVQGTLDGVGTPGLKGAGSTGQTGPAGHGHAGGTAIYVQSNVASPTTGTTLTIINGPTGRMYGGGGGGGGGYSDQGGAGASMLNGVWTNGQGSNPGQGGWWGSILWVGSANLTVSNTITNENSSHVIIGWDGRWA